MLYFKLYRLEIQGLLLNLIRFDYRTQFRPLLLAKMVQPSCLPPKKKTGAWLTLYQPRTPGDDDFAFQHIFHRPAR